MGLRQTLERLTEPDLTGDPKAALEFDRAVEALFREVETWLAPGGAEAHGTASRADFTLEEDGFHPRKGTVLNLVVDGLPAALRPVAALVAGARGRIDMSGRGDGEPVRILLDPRGVAGWGVASPAGHGFVPLDRRSLLLALQRLRAVPVESSPIAGPAR